MERGTGPELWDRIAVHLLMDSCSKGSFLALGLKGVILVNCPDTLQGAKRQVFHPVHLCPRTECVLLERQVRGGPALSAVAACPCQERPTIPL